MRNFGTGPVVVGVDGSPASEHALQWACAEAARRATGVVAVFVAPVFLPHDWSAEVAPSKDEGEALLREAINRVVDYGGPIETSVRMAPPVLSLRAEALRHGACLLVVGRRGSGRVRRLVVGSVSSGLAQDPVCPLAIIPADAPLDADLDGGGRVVVGVDGSPASQPALEWAAGEAARRGTVAEAVSAWSFPHLDLLPLLPPTHDNARVLHDRAKEALHDQLERLPASLKERVEPVLRRGGPADVLLDAATGASLVVVGSRGQGFFAQHVLGSTSHAVLHHCGVPLVIVPSSAARLDPVGVMAEAAQAESEPAMGLP